MGTLIVAVLVAASVIFAVVKIVKDKKAGSSCGGGCSSCPMSGSCHKKQE